jgi:hypothetical protein
VNEWSRGDASDIDGQTERSHGAFGKSDIEGKAGRVAASELGSERVSNEPERDTSSGKFHFVSVCMCRAELFVREMQRILKSS